MTGGTWTSYLDGSCGEEKKNYWNIDLFVVRTCETSLAPGPSYTFGFSSPVSCWFQWPRL
jgi:hypothetical protein